MSARKPIRVLGSGLSGRFYALTSYDLKPDGRIVANTKHDVTADIANILAAERERIAQAIEAYKHPGGFIPKSVAAAIARNST